MTDLTAAVLVLLVLGAYVTWTAQRLDRLHARVDAAVAALDAQLVRRAAAARGLAGQLPDAPLAEAAGRALAAEPADREAVESELTRALRAVLAEPPAGPATAALVREVDAAATRVRLARQFHNDAVRDTLVVRRRRVPRLLRLWGSAAQPVYFEIDDEVGPGTLPDR